MTTGSPAVTPWLPGIGSESEWRGLLERFERSGLPATRFSRQSEISVHTLRFWRRKLGRPSPASRAGLAEFVDLGGTSSEADMATTSETGACGGRGGAWNRS